MSFISKDLFTLSVYDKTASSDDTGLTPGQRVLIAAGILGAAPLLGSGVGKMLKSRQSLSRAAILRGKAMAYENALPKVDWATFAPKEGLKFKAGNPVLGTSYNRVWEEVPLRPNVIEAPAFSRNSPALENMHKYAQDLLSKARTERSIAEGYDMASKTLRKEAVRRILGSLGVAGATTAGTYAMD